jgi:V8-like Glu-specific endopeptidase
MVQLKSVSKPKPETAGLEAAAVPPPRKTTAAGGGLATTDVSRAARRLLGRGKSDQPIRREFVGGAVLETVIGVDDRVRIVDTDLPPWRMICSLTMQAVAGSAIGTGWLVGPKTVVTAGHCVFSSQFFGGWAQSIRLIPGRDGSEAPFGQTVATRFSATDRWVESEDADFDIGCIHLEEPLGDSVGWFAVGALPDAELPNFLVNVSGYPGDRGNGQEQYFHKNRILRVTDRRIFYDVDTFGGQSGAPAWIYEDGSDCPLAVGIHAYGAGGTPSAFGLTANSAPRIIPEVFDLIQSWIAEDNAA